MRNQANFSARRGATILFAFWAVSVWGQDLGKSIDLEVAATVPDVLASLTKSAGIELRAGDAFAREVVALRFKGVTVSEAMKKIGEALNADWTQQSGAYWLTRNEMRRQAERNAEAQVRADGFAKAIKKMSEGLDKPAMTPQEIEQELEGASRTAPRGGRGGQSGGAAQFMSRMADTTSRTPGGRAITRILQTLRPADLAAIPIGGRVVFATNPTRMQLSLPSSVLTAAQTLIQEQAQFDQAAQSSSGQGRAPTFMLGGGMGGRATGRVSKILLVVNRFGSQSMLTAQLTVANENGESMAFAFAPIAPEEPEVKDTVTVREGEAAFEFSAISKKLGALAGPNGANVVMSTGVSIAAASISTGSGGGGSDLAFSFGPGDGDASTKAPTDLRSLLLNPEKNEPLAWAPSELMLGAAKGREKNLVAVIPDSSFMPSLRLAANASKILPTDALRAAVRDWALTLTEDAGWIVARPTAQASARAARVDRKALGRMLRTVAEVGSLSLDNAAAYSLTQPDSADMGSLDMTLLRWIDPIIAGREMNRLFGQQRPMLRFYGTLGVAQRQALAAGQPLSLGALTQAQRGYLHEMVYFSMDGPQVQLPRSGPGQRGGPGGRGGFGGNLLTERTQVLPIGVPMTGRLLLNVQTEAAVVATRSGVPQARTFTADSYAMQLIQQERPEFAQINGGTSYDAFRLGRQVNYTFRFDLTPNTSLTRSLSDATFDMKANAVKYDALPAEFLTRVQQRLTALRRSFENGNTEVRVRRFGDGGNRDPQP